MKRSCLFLLLLVTLAATRVEAALNLLPNGDFSANASAFVAWPGYVGSSNAIAGGSPPTLKNPDAAVWAPVSGGQGINGPDAPGPNSGSTGIYNYPNPFGPANQSTDDLGNTVRDYYFLQDNGASVKQNETFKADLTYTLTFDTASRSGNAGNLAVIVNDGSGNVYDGRLNGGISPGSDKFYFETITFTTTSNAGAGSLMFFNNSGGGDVTVDVTNIRMTPEPAALVIWGLVIAGGLVVARRRKA